jgi:hypothetical protein
VKSVANMFRSGGHGTRHGPALGDWASGPWSPAMRPNDVPPLLLPAPRHLELHPGQCVVPESRLVSGLALALPGWLPASESQAWVVCQRTPMMAAEA